MNITIKIKNTDIHLRVEPNADSNVLRFAIFNPDRTRVKFLYNNSIYPTEEVEAASEKYRIFEDIIDPDFNHKTGKTIDKLTQFDLEAITDKKQCFVDDYRFHYEQDTLNYKSIVYTHEDIVYLIKAVGPLITNHEQESALGNYLYFEQKFVALQEPRLKKREAEQKATEEYFTF